MRFDIDSCNEILDTLTRNRSRSLLTGFGVFWGLFMLLFMLGGGDGVKDLLFKTFEGFATNTVIIADNATTKPYKGFKEGRKWRMTTNDVQRLKNLVPELETVTPIVSWSQTAAYGAQSSTAFFKGAYPDYTQIETPKLKYGRYINNVDIEQARKVCVIGKRVYNDLFPAGTDPCGEFIRVGQTYFRVVGVDFNAGNLSINGSADRSIVAPMNVAQSLFNTGSKVDLICMTAKPGVQMASLEPRLRQVMAREHMFDPDDTDAMYFVNAEELFRFMDNVMRGVDFLIWLIGLGTLLAGAVGVSNIMMVTVRERTTEIGIRRAIGATPHDILSQIIWESVLLTLVSGLLSIVFTVGVLSVVDIAVASGEMVEGVSFQISFGTAVLAALLLTVLGVAAGMAPASRAMKIKPVDAMRDE